MGRTKSPVSTELNVEVPLSDDLNVSLNAMTQHRMEIMQQLAMVCPMSAIVLSMRHAFIWHRALRPCWRQVSG